MLVSLRDTHWFHIVSLNYLDRIGIETNLRLQVKRPGSLCLFLALVLTQAGSLHAKPSTDIRSNDSSRTTALGVYMGENDRELVKIKKLIHDGKAEFALSTLKSQLQHAQNTHEQARLEWLLARANYEAGQTEKALQHLRNAARKSPDETKYYNDLNLILRELYLQREADACGTEFQEKHKEDIWALLRAMRFAQEFLQMNSISIFITDTPKG
jgi:tetratricopeptide (TPR) repeat protein